MPTNRKVIDFKIHNLTEEQFQELKEAGQIDPNAIYCTPDETVANFEAVNARIDETNKNLNTVDKKVDDAIQTEQQHNIEINARVDETVANFEEINTEIEALKDKGGVPLLIPIWADHTLNNMSWLNADTFSWQSGDVYVAAYNHLVEESNGKEGVSETVNGIEIWYVLAEDGHKICPATEESNVQALFESTGVAWYYIIDEANKQFKLPRTKFGFTGLRDSVGGYVEAGLPNITGKLYPLVSNSAAVGDWATKTGAFKKSSGATSGAAAQGSTYAYRSAEIDASDSSPVYGNSNTVQPEATQMYLYFYVGNFEREAIEQTAGLNAELFNSKADSNLKNTPLQVDSTGKILVSGTTLAQSTNNRELRFQVGDDVSNGSLLALYGQNSTLGVNGFLLRACLTPGEYNDLVGRTDGKLLWKSKRIPSLESEQLPTIDSGYLWYKVYDDGFVIQGGRCIGTWEIDAGQEQVPYVTMAIPMNTTHTFPFFTCKELYCFPMGWYMANSTTLRPRFGSYTVKRTLTQFDWVVFGRKA